MVSLKIGTRGSALALWQAERVRNLLSARRVTSEIIVIRTSGDEGSPRPASYLEGKGLFTKELEDALLEKRIDLAVHSVKDLGAVLPPGLEIVAYPEREDPRDALVSEVTGGLSGLPAGARVGTSSLRRIAALRGQRPDLEVVPLRGNVPTRVARVERGDVAAVILAMAGLKRLGLAGKAVPLDPTIFVPAPGQAALGIQIRSDDLTTSAAVSPLDDLEIRIGVEAERAAMAELEGGCRVPLGVTCVLLEGRRTLYARVYAVDGSRALSARVAVDPHDPRASGVRVARELLSAGAAALIRQFDTMPSSPQGRGEQGEK